MTDQPAWLKVIAKAERAVGGPLSRTANSDRSAELLLAIGRVRHLAADVHGFYVDHTAHLFNLPSRRDLQRLDVKVERLHRLVEDVAQTLEEERPDHGALA